MLEHMRELLRQAEAGRVLTCGCRSGQAGLPDRQPELGPLGGLLTLAQTQPDGIYLLVPVDMPLLTTALLQPLVAAVACTTEQACVTHVGHVLPLCLRLDAVARATIATLSAQPRRARSLRALHGALDGTELALAQGDERHMINCNTPEEWQRVTT